MCRFQGLCFSASQANKNYGTNISYYSFHFGVSSLKVNVNCSPILHGKTTLARLFLTLVINGVNGVVFGETHKSIAAAIKGIQVYCS